MIDNLARTNTTPMNDRLPGVLNFFTGPELREFGVHDPGCEDLDSLVSADDMRRLVAMATYALRALTKTQGESMTDNQGANEATCIGCGISLSAHRKGCFDTIQAENAQLRAQLADVTAQRDLLMAMCPAEKENTRLRAATQPLLEYLQHQGEFVRRQDDMVAFEEKPLMQLVHLVIQALPAEKEKP